MNKKLIFILIGVLGCVLLGMTYLYVAQLPKSSEQKTELAEVTDAGIEDGIDVASGFIAQGDYKLVIANCTSCHSSKLVTQNRASREGWQEMIRWMQANHKLWDLQSYEDPILDYLATYYAPEDEGRRRPLQVENWYNIE
ncbi:MAG: cytochrome C [Bacteroidota bacterium]